MGSAHVIAILWKKVPARLFLISSGISRLPQTYWLLSLYVCKPFNISSSFIMCLEKIHLGLPHSQHATESRTLLVGAHLLTLLPTAVSLFLFLAFSLLSVVVFVFLDGRSDKSMRLFGLFLNLARALFRSKKWPGRDGSLIGVGCQCSTRSRSSPSGALIGLQILQL